MDSEADEEEEETTKKSNKKQGADAWIKEDSDIPWISWIAERYRVS